MSHEDLAVDGGGGDGGGAEERLEAPARSADPLVLLAVGWVWGVPRFNEEERRQVVDLLYALYCGDTMAVAAKKAALEPNRAAGISRRFVEDVVLAALRLMTIGADDVKLVLDFVERVVGTPAGKAKAG